MAEVSMLYRHFALPEKFVYLILFMFVCMFLPKTLSSYPECFSKLAKE